MCAVVGAVIGLASADASAFTGYGLLPPAIGAFAHPTGMAVDQTSGNLYVADGSPANSIDVFGAEGGAPAGGGPSQITGAETPAGTFNFASEPTGVAVDNSGGPSNGAIYVTDVVNSVIDKFRLNGSNEYEYVCQITGFGNVGIGCLKNKPTKETSPSTNFSEPLGVTVDTGGDLYVADYGSRAVYEYSPGGEDVEKFTSPLIGNPQGVAVDTAGDVFIQAYGSPNTVVELKRNSLVGPAQSETEITQHATGLAVDRASRNLFVDVGNEVDV
jgi:hypothetical protein